MMTTTPLLISRRSLQLKSKFSENSLILILIKRRLQLKQLKKQIQLLKNLINIINLMMIFKWVEEEALIWKNQNNNIKEILRQNPYKMLAGPQNMAIQDQVAVAVVVGYLIQPLMLIQEILYSLIVGMEVHISQAIKINGQQLILMLMLIQSQNKMPFLFQDNKKLILIHLIKHN